jgi:hypothetical protein
MRPSVPVYALQPSGFCNYADGSIKYLDQLTYNQLHAKTLTISQSKIIFIVLHILRDWLNPADCV